MNRAYLTNPDRWNPDIEATRDRVNERICTGVNPEEFDPREEPRRFAFWIAVAAVLLIGLSLIASIH